MESFISFSKWRRSEWKGHDDAKGVRSAIRYARRNSTELRLFFRHRGIALSYVEIPPEDWDAEFFPAKPKPKPEA
jgi:hypothetical protein